jgi:hypothetical protein
MLALAINDGPSGLQQSIVTTQGALDTQLVPLVNAILQLADAPLTADQTVGGPTTILSVTLNGTQPGSRFLISANGAAFTTVAGVAAVLRLKVDGVFVPGSSRACASADQFDAMATQAVVGPLPPGSHTFDLEAECTGGALALFWPVTLPAFLGANLLVEEVPL